MERYNPAAATGFARTNTMGSKVLMLGVYGVAAYIISALFKPVEMQIMTGIQAIMMNMNMWLLIALACLPEQIVLQWKEPQLDWASRAYISLCMYFTRFAWNGITLKAPQAYDEVVWILATAFYAQTVIGIRAATACTIAGADALTTLIARSIL